MTDRADLLKERLALLHSRPGRAGLLLAAAALVLACAHYTVPASSFAADSLMKVLEAKGWLESGFQSQEIYYRARAIDPEFSFLPIHTTVTQRGEHVGPFPFANTLLIAPFVAANMPAGIVYFSALLFCLYLAILYGITKRYSALVIAAAGTPLLHHFLSFSDVAAAAVLSLLAVLLIYRQSPLFSVRSKASFFSGCLLGAACWYRPEVLILAGSLLLSAAGIKLLRDRRLPEEWPEILKFTGGFALILLTFVSYNYLRYDLILGPRIDSNRTILSFDLADKLTNVKELLFTGSGRVGFLSFSPWYGIVMLCVVTWKHWSEKSRILACAFLLNLAAVCLLTPNNSNIDWGTRYLSCSVFIPVLLLHEMIVTPSLQQLVRRVALGFAAVLVLYSATVNQRVFKFMRKSSLQLAWIQSEIPWDSSKIFVTKNVEIANAFGLQYLSQTILLIRNESNLDQILRHPDTRHVVLIEHGAQPNLARFAGAQDAGRFSIKARMSAGGLLSIAELTKP